MNRVRFLLLLSVLVVPAFAETPVDAPKSVSDVFDPRLATEAFYDCSSTPSYLTVRTVDAVDDEPFEAEVFFGSRVDCEAQVKELRRYRGSFKVPGTVAACAGTPTYLHRFVVQPAVLSWHVLKAGRVVKMKPQVYPSLAECRDYAKQLNGAVAMPTER